MDVRTDVFAYGAVLYEMVTGRRAFGGESRASIIAAIMGTVPPNVHESAPLAPPMLDTIVAKALAKSPEDRWQSMRDVGIVLGAVSEPSPTPEPLRPQLTVERAVLPVGRSSSSLSPSSPGFSYGASIRPDPISRRVS